MTLHVVRQRRGAERCDVYSLGQDNLSKQRYTKQRYAHLPRYLINIIRKFNAQKLAVTRDVNEAKAEAEARKSEAEDEADATMYAADARHVREQLNVYEHED